MLETPSPPLQCVFSGIQPSGTLHLGNYLGAVAQWVTLQHRTATPIFCIVDWHALTVWQDPAALRAGVLDLAASLLACGIDPQKSILFPQSLNPDHVELAWLLNCVARFGWVSRMTQFKEKSGKNREQASLGLFAYPVLMAADILAYPTNGVPVGDDQRQHLELTREIAIRFHDQYGGGDSVAEPLLIPPATLVLPTGARVMSLRDGNKKMSKSDPSDAARIDMTDDDDTIRRKIQRARTDSLPFPETAMTMQDRPEVANLIGIYAALRGESIESVMAEFAGGPFAPFKEALAESLVETIRPIRTRTVALRADEAALVRMLTDGAGRARAISQPRLARVRQMMGLL
ncbi:MAG: tryptophan--tRNA ligase [Alphaproteobacteria bacterium]|nr:tryptophan--tRNA ligase [Alphaproteobacteria bacterium]